MAGSGGGKAQRGRNGECGYFPHSRVRSDERFAVRQWYDQICISDGGEEKLEAPRSVRKQLQVAFVQKMTAA